MTINIDLFKVGYFVGKYSTRIVAYATGTKLAISGYLGVSRIASEHKINSIDPIAQSENLFKCLEYLN